MNDRTSASQWDFPKEDDKEEDPKGSQGTQAQTSSEGDIKTSMSAGGVTGQSFSAVAAPQTRVFPLNICLDV